MGRVRTKTVKKSSKVIIERYYPKLTLDFETNKRICDEIAIIASKRLRNKVRYPSAEPKLPAQGMVWDTIAYSYLDCRLHHPSDEAHSTRTRSWHFLQATGGGERTEGSICARGLCFGLRPELRERPTGYRRGD